MSRPRHLATMQSLEVTEEQYAYIQQLREEISEQVVGKYGHVRERDAVQFLIDNLDGDLEIDDDFAVAEEADLAYDEGEATPEDGEDLEDGDEGDEEDPEPEGGADGYEPEPEGEDEVDDTGGDDESGEDGTADDDDMLDRMMSLLDTHDDKWEESPSADHRYRVTLPDGSTEDVQTKDDVRALLFQNY